MNILITGGAGFIGSHVCEALLKQGHNICIYDNFNDYYSPGYKCNNVQQVQHIARECGQNAVVAEGDIRDIESLNTCFGQHDFDAVIHLAACAGVRPSIEDATLYVDVNLIGTTNILDAMRNHGVGKLLFASSSSVYGNNEKVPFSESDFVDNPISPYAATKKAGELLCHTYSHLYGIAVACLRFFTVYGPRQRPDLAIYKFTQKIIAGERIQVYGDGGMSRDYTYIDDTVNGVKLALDWVFANETKAKYEVFNLGESYTISINNMVKTIEQTTDKVASIVYLPVPPGDVKITCADISKAKRMLGYDPTTSFETGIGKFVDWFCMNRN